MFLSGYTKVYFLGIGGIGMSALARYFAHSGCTVSGYDKTSTALTGQLENEGIKIHYKDLGQDIIKEYELNPKDTLVVYTPAVPKDFKELLALNENGFRVRKRAAVLGMISDNYFTIAVAGTHGKTTTSTLIAHILQQSGRNVLAFLGGISANYNTNLLLPAENENVICVVEADEYDRSFLHIHPDISIITSADADHLDIYGNRDTMLISFEDFAGNLRKEGTLICKKDLPLNLHNLKSFTYSAKEDSDYSAKNISIRNSEYYFDFEGKNASFKDLHIGLPGWHNVENATAAIAAALLAGVSENQVRQGLSGFRGVKRRFEYIIKEPGCIYIDDYAHHPRELHAIISSLKELYPGENILGVFQPHLFSRTRDFAEEFAQSLNLLDELILLDIYPARELPIEGVSSRIIFDKITIPKTICSLAELKDLVVKTAPGILVTLGAGDIDTQVPVLKTALGLLQFEKYARANFPEIRFSYKEPMAKHTWLKIGGEADIFIKPKNNLEITRIAEYAWEHKLPLFILGNGSNILVGDKGIRGLVIAVGEAEAWFKQEGNKFTVSASYSLPKFVLDTLKLGYEGLESLAGVPCTIGGATRMNAGAYGVETFDFINEVKFIHDGEVITRSKDEIVFSYRHTEFENDIILETTFILNPSTDIEAVNAKRKELLEKRKNAQPLDKPNTGSVFKNPLPEYAGKLIEDAGLKGFTYGQVQVSPKHANFIVNNGGATAKEFVELVNLIKEKVKAVSRIELQTEVLYTGEF
jgi:UDP-N-acetylmuramate--alanine ligase